MKTFIGYIEIKKKKKRCFTLKSISTPANLKNLLHLIREGRRKASITVPTETQPHDVVVL